VQPATPRGRAPRAPLSLLLPAAVLLPLALLAMGGWMARNAVWEQARTELTHSADAGAEYARSVLELHRMRALRANELLRGMSDQDIRQREPELHTALRRLLEVGAFGEVFRLYVFDRAGGLLVNTDFQPSPAGSYADREYFRTASSPDAPDLTVGEAAVGRANGLPFFPVTLRREGTGNGLPGGSFDGLINVSVSPDSMTKGLTRLRGGEHDILSLVREDGSVLARTTPMTAPPPWRQPGDAAVLAAMRAGEPRFERLGTSPLDGVTRLVAYRQVDGWPLYVAAARDEAEVRARWLWRLAGLLLFGLPAIAALGLLALLARQAHREAEQARAGLEARVRERTAELARRTSELAASEGRLRLALEAADLGTWEADLRQRICIRGPRGSEILGNPPRESVGSLDAWRDLLHPEDRPAAIAAFDALCEGRTDRYRAEYRIMRPDGQWVWVESCAQPLERDTTGRPLRLSGTLRDVTARREAEERRTLLAREVDHRAKNALAVVQAALRLTPRDDPQRYAGAVEGRVAALARAHTLLAERRWDGADLRQLLEGELSAFTAAPGAAEPRQAELVGPDLRVSPPAAQSLSIAFHELATNAVKYGALARRTGRLRVSWEVDAAAGQLRIEWRENGGPPIADTPSRRGFGSRVVTATLRDQLGGRLEQRWMPGGLEVDIAIPLARITADAAPSVSFEATG
jgi:PAS domain S-box-containing protein